MPILKPTPPPAVEEAFSKGLPAYLSVPDRNIVEQYAGTAPELPTLAELGLREDAISYHNAQQVFVLALNDAVNAANANAATPAGWRLFAGNTVNKTMLGRVSSRQTLSSWKLTSAYYGERVWNSLQASRALDALPEVRAGNYELRVLTVPGLSLETFWLVAHTQGFTDLVVPFPAKPNQPISVLNEESIYKMPNFLAAIRPLILLRLKTQLAHGN
jgi:hypothetical protein